ncbi:hypothetical protein RN001_000919 [Aquatica leii]|uniref:Uncharacterized protein n=1 Tax=Aquatica leii TaxID=1421715 RepID=A0AAN7PFV3_9COLE|nr:hypothetical protein RN001_000919 [Aquatica leii]
MMPHKQLSKRRRYELTKKKSTWKTYPCTIRCNSKSFETFEEALLKCKVLLDHTDSSSCALTDSDNGSGEKSRERSETKDALLNEISKVQNAVDYNRRLIEQFITQMKREWDTIKIQVMSFNGQQKQQIDPLNSVFDELLPLTSMEDITICSELLEEGEKEKLFISKLSMIGDKVETFNYSNAMGIAKINNLLYPNHCENETVKSQTEITQTDPKEYITSRGRLIKRPRVFDL